METRDPTRRIAYKLTISGQVQGVGFRPHVYRLAQQLNIIGWVRNQLGLVVIHAQGAIATLSEFIYRVIQEAPSIATPNLDDCDPVAPIESNEFLILDSVSVGQFQIHVPPDLAVCNDCLIELFDTNNRRYRYPFINCTQCGPRYTIIHSLPYDRANTTMRDFPLCPVCYGEYTDSDNRRFHAEPLACATCGPSLNFHIPSANRIHGNAPSLSACVEALRAGLIIAIRGIGGYHLCCAAEQESAISRLRQHKPRPHKPLAIMFPAPLAQPLREVMRQVHLSPKAAALLLSPTRPIVLATRRPDCTISFLTAPGLNELGVMLPYSSLQYLLLQDFDAPLVVTSANLSGEPILTEPDAVETRLNKVAEGFLHHNRPIARPADDPVYRNIGQELRPLRLGRGNSPLELTLPFRLEQPVLATGSHNKNTIALAWERRIIISSHIGDLSAARSLDVFIRTISDLQMLYAIKATMVLCDAHPSYASTHWAKQCGLPWRQIFHHHAHASAVYGNMSGTGNWLVFSWDGFGYGEDGILQGGEAFLGYPGNWQHFASFRPFFLPGGQRASMEPWRSAAAMCWETGRDFANLPEGAELAKHAWQRRLNSPKTTSVGRIFDAAAALIGLCYKASFDGQAPMLLETACIDSSISLPNKCDLGLNLPLTLTSTGLWITDWEPLLPMLQNQDHNPTTRATCFHATIAQVILQQAQQAQKLHNIKQIGLSGGVFQNRVLTNMAIKLLNHAGFNVTLPLNIPVNDAGISYGQVIEHMGIITN